MRYAQTGSLDSISNFLISDPFVLNFGKFTQLNVVLSCVDFRLNLAILITCFIWILFYDL